MNSENHSPCFPLSASSAVRIGVIQSTISAMKAGFLLPFAEEYKNDQERCRGPFRVRLPASNKKAAGDAAFEKVLKSGLVRSSTSITRIRFIPDLTDLENPE